MFSLARYLAISATNTQSEKVLSTNGRVCNSTRTCLEPGYVEGLVVVNKNKKLFKEYKKVEYLV